MHGDQRTDRAAAPSARREASTLPELFERQARDTPDRVAVT